ncbi:hypothetical protein QJS10_CPA09g00461 [Acorus calamus]|uniref:Uncharacterized protein n=1 Tax=Acorus calamus TaxID=4465 RepID=A0AAV9E2T5_ACOCL|nr:hypothetical protein QJS10_CPA09g00461 [Acorus calamus]
MRFKRDPRPSMSASLRPRRRRESRKGTRFLRHLSLQMGIEVDLRSSQSASLNPRGEGGTNGNGNGNGGGFASQDDGGDDHHFLPFNKPEEASHKLWCDCRTKSQPRTSSYTTAQSWTTSVRMMGGAILNVFLGRLDIYDTSKRLPFLQDIMQGVRSSTRAVRLAEDGLHRLTTMAPGPLVDIFGIVIEVTSSCLGQR